MLKRTVWVFSAVVVATLTAGVGAREDPPKKLSDAEISKLIVGKWAIDEGGGKGPKVKGTEEYKKDGTVEAEATIDDGTNPPIKITLSGTWKVMDGVITSTVTKSSKPDIIKVGLVSKDTVISIDDKEYKYKSQGGEEKVQKRVKDKD